MNLENAKLLGNRHLAANEKFEIDAHNVRHRLVRITATPAVAATPAGQHCLWMLTNLLARQFGVITALEVDVPPIPTVPGTALFGAGQTLRETLLNTARLVAGDAMDIREAGRQKQLADAEAGVGAFQPRAPFSVSVLADGWKVLAGKPGSIPLFVPS